jgi:hypothetical protein
MNNFHSKYNFIVAILVASMVLGLMSCKAFRNSSIEVIFADNIIQIDCGDNYTIKSEPDDNGIYTIKHKEDGKNILLSFYTDADFSALEAEMMTWTRKGYVTGASFLFDASGNGKLDYSGFDGTTSYYRQVRYLAGTDIYAILDAASTVDMTELDQISIVVKEISAPFDHSKRINELANYMQNYAGTKANIEEGQKAYDGSSAASGDGVLTDASGIGTSPLDNANIDESLLTLDGVTSVLEEFGYTNTSKEEADDYKTILYTKAGSATQISLTIMYDLSQTDDRYRDELSSTGYDKVPNPVVMRVPNDEGYARYYAAMHDDDAILIIYTDDADECSRICARFGLVYQADSDAYDEITYGEEPAVPAEGVVDLSLEKYRAVASYFGIIDDISETLDDGNIVGGDFMDGTTMSHAYVDSRYVQATFEEMLKAYGIQGPNPCVFKMNSRFIVIAYDTGGNIIMVSSTSGTRLARICGYFGLDVTKDDQ